MHVLRSILSVAKFKLYFLTTESPFLLVVVVVIPLLRCPKSKGTLRDAVHQGVLIVSDTLSRALF